MHGQVDLAAEHALVYLRHEDAKAGQLVQRLIQEDISAGLDFDQLRLHAQGRKLLLNNLRLAQCQGASPAAHDQLFRQEENASRVVWITSGLCAADMKSVSYWLGVRKMPESSIRWKKAR